MVYPMWIIGPSGPTGKPHPTAATQEKNFTASVFTLNIWRTMVPLRNPVTSGIPEPAALGRKNCANKNKSWIFHCFVIHSIIILWWWNSILLSIQCWTHHNNEWTEYNENQTVCNSNNTCQCKIIVLKLKKIISSIKAWKHVGCLFYNNFQHVNGFLMFFACKRW